MAPRNLPSGVASASAASQPWLSSSWRPTGSPSSSNESIRLSERGRQTSLSSNSSGGSSYGGHSGSSSSKRGSFSHSPKSLTRNGTEQRSFGSGDEAQRAKVITSIRRTSSPSRSGSSRRSLRTTTLRPLNSPSPGFRSWYHRRSGSRSSAEGS